MPIVNVLQPAGTVTTEASVRAATRNAMLTTIHGRLQQSQELHVVALRDKELQEDQSVVSGCPEKQPLEVSEVRLSPPSQKRLQPLHYHRYEIARLIELGKNVQDSPKVLLNVKPEAIAENLFQYMGIAPDLRPPPRSRGLTDISNFSRRSIMSSNGTNEWDPSHQSRPTPLVPDSRQTSRLQQHEGFVRFLKQHVSPPHQRVTAGGRIVPTGPMSPPPMFDYASLNGLVRQQQIKAHAISSGQTNSPFNYHPNLAPPANLTRSSPTFPATHGSQPAKAQTVVGPAMVSATVDNGDKPYFQQPLMSPAAALALTQLSMVHLGFFPDGTALISCNGVCYRSYWNGVSTIMEPITTGQSMPTMNEPGLQYPLTSPGQPTYGGQPTATMKSSASDLKGILPSLESSTMPNFRPSQPISHTDDSVPHVEENMLRSQLTSLDKYLALHHYDIGPAERTNLVSQRKTLVEAIAKRRSNREPSTQMIPIINGRRLGNRKSSTQPIVSGDREVSIDVDRALKKSLSPSAPAFVPSGATVLLPGDLKPGLSAMQSATAKLGRPSLTKDMTSTTMVTERLAEETSLQATSSTSHTEPCVEADPWDPAMKIIPASMITYAQKYHAETTESSKKYCTTIEEFQEAIRRVREQARMWGCVGGNSKDPAYDAEEDIWYAIKDEYPIPLPAKTPDHIVCPRPWNWYDSAFNVNATIEPQINMRGDVLKQEVRPALTATLIKYSLEDTEAPSKQKRESTRDMNARYTSNSTSSSHLSRVNVPLAMLREDTERYHIQQHKLITPTRQTNSKTIDLRGQGTSRKDAFAHGPVSSRFKGDYPQKINDTEFPNPGGQSSHWPSPAQAIATIYGHEQVCQTPSPHPMSPSSVAISAAQVAYGAKGLVSKGPIKTQAEYLSDPHFVSRDEMRTMTTTGSRFAQRSKVPRNSSSNRATLSPLLESVQSESSKSIGMSTDTHQRHDLADGLSAESRGAWGPEEICAATDENIPKVRIPTPMSRHEAVGSRRHASRPREAKLASKPVDGQEAGPTSTLALASIAGSLTTGTYTFLKDMLKSPRYSSGFRRQNHGLKDRATGDKGAQRKAGRKLTTDSLSQQQSDPRTTEKENFSSAPEILRRNVGSQTAVNSSTSTSYTVESMATKSSQEPSVLNANKTNSSLASSAYHASGYLPPYDGMGKERATSIYQRQLKQKPDRKPRVNLPASSSHARPDQSDERSDQRRSMSQALYNVDVRHMPAILGYDGSEDPLPEDDNTRLKGKGKEKVDCFSSDCKDVTSADFDQHRPDHDNEWHRGAVNDFFRELHEKEVRYMMARQRKNTKTAP